jgi:hypothetical protein
MGAGVHKQLGMLRTELLRRLKHPFAPGGLFKQAKAPPAVPV